MKAVVCKDWGKPETLIYKDIPDAVADAGNVVVEVKATSVNFVASTLMA